MALYNVEKALFVIATIACMLAMPRLVLRWNRKKDAAKLGPTLRDTLLGMTKKMFDQPPVGRIEEGGRAVVEGLRHGEPVAVRTDFMSADSQRALGLRIELRFEMSVLIGLRGATSKVSLIRHGHAISDSFEERWKGELDEGLFDDETKTAIMDWVARGPRAHRLEVGLEGLAIAFGETHQANEIEMTLDLAHRVQKRILEVLEARPPMPGDAYRS